MRPGNAVRMKENPRTADRRKDDTDCLVYPRITDMNAPTQHMVLMSRDPAWKGKKESSNHTDRPWAAAESMEVSNARIELIVVQLEYILPMT